MRDGSFSATESRVTGNRVIAIGIAAVVVILAVAAVALFISLPDANAFNARVERIFSRAICGRMPSCGCWRSSRSPAPPSPRPLPATG